ncbi:right-handed parallel beta-helix repeat-containing protein [Rhizobium ruizarguesonis]|uniref:right-handed parallel beta-helix repeat-containing protein n=1 Tax=Rhizobium ruizarguesonis TaxID=2081791 RepID=UPI001031E7D4|nr:right-handed parallel beta-helix repeat-containing protein [Rhizobium ruizarguesonis]TAU13409.1 right-handed parallel beta-helix repeat-containing protein [Rhizobium ruizarguesonis]TAU57120.1 right-handed parallel beta-helix repeat-containing protein [Rhizobium ruizarguesonis]TAV01738.1 right-handed parallel beta-helix repeat-containing protein [Rhizobium ruizarguesonis]TAV28348.1 right-handed parallel beta-helix repeat-containing protein [Rhizobium ruizarguesonis]TAW60340.1 right-handed pa
MRTGPSGIDKAIARLEPGSKIHLNKGRFRAPITVNGKRGSQSKPITIRGPKAKIGSDLDFEGYRGKANKLADAHQKAGSFPGVYFLADDAALVLKDCQWVIIEDLYFENCWPTAIYLDNCQHIFIRRVSFRGGTFAIGAAGPNTRHLLIENCDWVQDVESHGTADVRSIRDEGRSRSDLPPSDCKLWSQIPWKAVHGAGGEDGPVAVGTDARAYDGDFFRAWTIAGYVIIRNNVIVDAFNGVHFFNQASVSTKANYARNVIIEDNWFVRVRDNAVEPEDFAWNWTIRRNKFVDCYVPFSFEMQQSGHFYVYGNLGWNFHLPGPDGDTHASGALFKLPEQHLADGPHYIFNNTWLLRAPIVKKKRISGFEHRNNLIGYAEAADKFKWPSCSPLGNSWSAQEIPSTELEDRLIFERGCFTRSWKRLGIVFDGDLIGHPDFPDALREAGYQVGHNAHSGAVKFADEAVGLPHGLAIPSPPAGQAFSIQSPDQTAAVFNPANYVVGAWQSGGIIAFPDPGFLDVWPMPSE